MFGRESDLLPRARTKILLAVIAFAMSSGGSAAATFNCGEPPPLHDEQLKGRIAANAQGIGRQLGAGFEGAIQTSRSEVLSKYPHADRVLGDAFFNYEVCSIVMNDKALTSAEKLDLIMKARKAFLQPIAKPKPKPTAIPTAANDRPQASVVPPVSINGQSGGEVAVIGSVGTFNQGAIPLSRKQYLPTLQSIYEKGSSLSVATLNDYLSDEQLDKLFADFNAWATDSASWIEKNMTAAASAKFLSYHVVFGASYELKGQHDEPHQKKYQALRVLIPQMLTNVEYLMSTDAMDPQH